MPDGQEEFNKEIERKIELLEKVKKLNEEELVALSAVEASQARNAKIALENLQQYRDQYQILIDSNKEQIKSGDLKENEILGLKRQNKELQKMSIAYEKHHKEVQGALKGTEELQGKLIKKIADVATAGEKQLEHISSTIPEKTEQSWTDTFQMLHGGLSGMGQVIEGVFNNPALVLASTLGVNNMTHGVKGFLKIIQDMPAQVDKHFHQVMKETGLSSAVLYDSMTAMLDPLYAQREQNLFRGLAEEAKPLANIGLDAKAVGSAMTALIADASLFRPAFIENNKEVSIFVGNLMAGLQKIGVPLQTSAKNLDTFTKAMQLTPKEAAKSIKSLVSIADSLGVEAKKVAQNFEKVTPDIVQFGSRSIEVFAKLQAQAAATGVEVSRLANFAKGLDTFEGAATKAQMLNAVLGDTFLSVTDLVHADFPDKITMIQDAMANAGIDFDTADRRMKQVIANAAGFESVGEAAKFLTNKEAAEEFADTVDSTAYSQEDLKARVIEGMTAAEKMTRTMSSLAGGVTKFNKRIHVAASQAGGILVGTFSQIYEKTRDSEEALGGVVLALQGIDTTVKGIGTGFKALGTKFLPGAGAEQWTKVLTLMKSSHVLKVATALGTGAVITPIVGGMKRPSAAPGVPEAPTIPGAWTPPAPTMTPVPPAHTYTEEMKTGEELRNRKLEDMVKSIDEMTKAIKNQELNVELKAVLDGEEVGKRVAPTVIRIHDAQPAEVTVP